MPSKKPIYKKPYEKVDHYEESVWLSNDTPIFETEFTAVFRDRYPCVEGHTLFIPKKDTSEYIGKSYELAYQTAQDWVTEGIMDGYNLGMNIGNCAGQTIYWPHIHLIPRHEGDADKKGGMRYAHPGADHYEYYSEEDTYEKD
jgi:diadenosine tetraphosphate (Ap4A) HIT family hydrolase